MPAISMDFAPFTPFTPSGCPRNLRYHLKLLVFGPSLARG